MANRLWEVAVEPTDLEVLMSEELGLIVPQKRLVNAEYITRVDVAYNTLDDTWRLELFIVNAPPVVIGFQTKQEALDALEIWSVRVEHAGVTLQL